VTTPVAAPATSPTLGARDLNRLRVIESIYRHRGCSRTDIARRTGLSRGTVSSVAEELARAELIREHEAPEEEQGPRGTGRPPTLISLVPGAAFAIGIDIGHQHVRVIVCDLAGEPVAEQWARAQVDDARSATLDLAHDLTQRALQDEGRSGCSAPASAWPRRSTRAPARSRRTASSRASDILLAVAAMPREVLAPDFVVQPARAAQPRDAPGHRRGRHLLLQRRLRVSLATAA
jgi:MarR family protein